MNNRIPLMVVEGFIICFQALPDDTPKSFTAEVSSWMGGVELGSANLGGCSGKPKDFYTKYREDYFAQMVDEAVCKAKSHLSFLADPDGSQLKRDHGITRKQLAEVVAAKYSEAYRGNCTCYYSVMDKVYYISGHNLPAHPSVQHVYPNGWSMGTIASEEEAIDIFTGRTKITGIVTVVEVGNVTKDEHGNQGTDAASDQGRTEG